MGLGDIMDYTRQRAESIDGIFIDIHKVFNAEYLLTHNTRILDHFSLEVSTLRAYPGIGYLDHYPDKKLSRITFYNRDEGISKIPKLVRNTMKKSLYHGHLLVRHVDGIKWAFGQYFAERSYQFFVDSSKPDEFRSILR